MSKVRVVVLRSLSYSGTSWVNLVLGSHPDAMALGPSDRLWRLPESEADLACLVHREKCWFWPPFIRGYERSKNVLIQLAHYSEKSIIVLNNPTAQMFDKVLQDPALELKFIQVVRDGRANLHSVMRHHPDRHACVYDAARNWLRPAVERLNRYFQANGFDYIRLHYEDMVTNPTEALPRIGAFLGVNYPENAVKYWEHEHHLIAGNTGVIDLLQRLQGGTGFSHRRKEAYDEFLARTKANPEQPVTDESWRDAFSRADSLAYDYVMGSLHEDLGYERDVFTVKEREAFRSANKLPMDVHRAPLRLPESLGKRLRYRIVHVFGSSVRKVASAAKSLVRHRI